jgi:A1 cistron-splicing factor AAR2
VDKVINQLQEELKIEDKKREKAERKQYKYKEVYGKTFYTDIPQKKVLQGLSGKALTEVSLDKTMILDDLIKKEYSGSTDDLLGEFQYAFTTFMLAQNFESFEQWKAIFVLISDCNQALCIESYEPFFFVFVPVVYA